MALFFGIDRGQQRVSAGLRIAVSDDGERVWMHGKWLDLGEDHAVVYADESCRFVRAAGAERTVGSFPSWVVRGRGKRPALAIMTNIAQFRGGSVRIGRRSYPVAA